MLCTFVYDYFELMIAIRGGGRFLALPPSTWGLKFFEIVYLHIVCSNMVVISVKTNYIRIRSM